MIGIIGAMAKETTELLARLEKPETERVSGYEFTRGILCGREVVVCTCGAGKVSAAVCAEAMILRFSPSLLINTGVGGSLSPELDVMDVLFATSVVQHDMDTTPLGDPYGLISGLDRVYIDADREAVRLLGAAADEIGIRHREGVIASGDLFVSTPEEKARILSHFPDAMVCEMEGAAIGQVAYMNGVPFVVARTASDRVDGKGAMTYAAFAPIAAKNSVEVLCRFLSGKVPLRYL